jgi:AAA domain
VTEMCTVCTARAKDGICRTCSQPCEACECTEFYRDPQRKPPARAGREQDATLTPAVADGDRMDEPESPFREFDLAALVKNGVPPPDLLCGDLLYRGGLHSIAGPPDSGKTTVALHWALQLIRGGGCVLFLDEEGGGELIAEKLIALDCTPEEASRIRYYPFPARSWNAYDVLMLRELIDVIKPGIVLWDSSAAFLSRAGLDENSASDVTRFWSAVLTPIAREHGTAVLVIDHDVKNGEASRFARGSGAKLAATDVAFKLSITQAFDRTTNGVLKMHVTKDRRGWLHRFWEIGIDVSNGMRLVFTETTEDGAAEAVKLSPAAEKIQAVLTDEPATIATITDRIVAKFGHGLRRETVSRCLSELAQNGIAEKLEQGKGKPAFWSIYAGQTCDITPPGKKGPDL